MVEAPKPEPIDKGSQWRDTNPPSRTQPVSVKRNHVVARMVLWCLALLAAVAGVYLFLRRGQSSGETQYRIATAQVQMVRKTVSASGVIEPWTTVDIKSKAGGRIDQLLVDVGDRIKAGQIIARIDPTDSLLTVNQAQADTASAMAKESQTSEQYRLQVAQTQLLIAQARSQVSSVRAALVAARARLATARHQSSAQPALTNAAIAQAQASLDAAKQDRAQLDATQPQDYATAQSTYDQATANMNAAKLLFERKSSLAKDGFIAVQEVDDARAAYEVVKSQVSAAKTRLDKLAGQQKAAVAASDAKVRQADAQLRNARAQSVENQTKEDSVREAEAAYSQAQAQLDQAESQLQQALANGANNTIRQLDIMSARAAKSRAQASLTNAKTTLDQTVVRAPAEGVVLQKYVEQGTIITSGLSFNSTGTSIVQLGDVSRLYVDVAVDETDVANVHEGQRVDVSVDAYPNGRFFGRVIKVAPRAEVDQNVTSVHVRVELSSRSPAFRQLKPTMNATCDFVVDERRDVVAVPSDAVHQDSGGSYVDVAVGGKIAPVDPKLGLKPDPDQLVGVKTQRRKVETGLEGNDTVEILSGLRKGERIVLQKIEPSAATTTTARTTPFGNTGRMGPGPGGPPPGMGGGGNRSRGSR